MIALAAILSAFAMHPVTCAPSIVAYNVGAHEQTDTRWWAGVAGFYSWGPQTITLSPQTCADLEALRTTHRWTWQRGYAVEAFAHEVGHSTGLVDESAADCYGAAHASEVAYLLGMRGRAQFAAMIADGRRDWGYAPIPAGCFP